MPTTLEAPEATSQQIKTVRLLFYFGLMYFCQGICQIVFLVNQPIRAYLKTLDYNAEQIANFFWIANIPWIIKPAYGLISDFIPLFGYRRRSYLFLMNMVAALGFLWMAGMMDVRVLTIAAVIVGLGVAMADVIVDALMVEAGQKTGLVGRFQSIQWMCMSAAGIASGVLGSLLLKWYPPAGALRIAAIICCIMPLGVAITTFWAVKEEKARLDLPQLKMSLDGLLAAFKSPKLLAVVAFLALLCANPGVYTPMNTYMTSVLGISDSFTALTDAFYSAGNVLGAGIFMAFFSRVTSLRKSLVIGILANTVSMVPFLFLRGPTSAGIAYGVFGVGYMVGNLAMLSLAAQACPKRAEGFVFAAMMSVLNFSAQTADNIGSSMYERILDHRVMPLILISMAISLIALPIALYMPALVRKPEAE